MDHALQPPNGSIQPPARLVTNELSVHFDHRSALDCVSLTFRAGQTTSLLGPNGAGKSTLLRVLAGMLPPTHGFVRLGGRPLRRADQEIVYVPQRSSVDWTFPVSVIEVVLMARANQRSRWLPYSPNDHTLAEEALDKVGMRAYANVQIGALSGGQQQRVFLARALVEAGDVYLLDEPFAGVDIPTQELLVSLFDDLRREGNTIVYATHDLAQAAQSSDQIVLLNRQLIAAGPPRSVMTATNLRATFGGQAIVPIDFASGLAAT